MTPEDIEKSTSRFPFKPVKGKKGVKFRQTIKA